VYFPWIQVFDPISDGLKFMPPSGYVAGVYARVDNQRGVHKAPANEPILGAMGLKQEISKIKQEPLNQMGINCIRNLNGNIRIWGARTLGAGKDNPDFKYINIRRQFNYIRESIDEGTQWTVFEPNTPELWARIRRNISAFLTNEWRKGALFGTTPQEAFFVKCDAETNPIDVRKLGQVITEIGVSVIEPAEFVIFRITQIVTEEKV
jgi:phage tail sheath protein FI